MYLVSPGARRGTTSSRAGVARRCSVSTSSSPMSASTTRPARKRPGATTIPTFGAWNVTVRSAWTTAPATSPVDASTPEGRSTETTGAAAALIRSMAAAASARGSPRNPVPKSASTITSAPSTSPVSSTVCPASRSTRAATRPSPPFDPPPQTHANRRAAGNASIVSRATAVPARSISSGMLSGYPA